jgi:GcrA cell cycle regulator
MFKRKERAMSNAWSAAEIEQLHESWRNGIAVKEIALALNRSRNAVLGKALRENLIKRQPGRPRMDPEKRRDMATPKYDYIVHLKPPPKPRKEHLTPFDLLPPDTVGLHFLMDLGRDDCRYALNNALQGEFYFCGERVKTGSPYCEKHHGICRIPPPVKEKRT